jgi:pimeloyl-ACP methyl ester carboxylesterase
MTTKLFGDLAGDLTGEPGRRPPLVLLHGLTFDRTSWHPVLAELTALDPGRPVLALDLPGHGESPTWPGYDLEPIADPVAGVVNVDQPLQVEPFARLVRSLAGPLRGPGFAQVWEQFEASMGIGLLPQDRQELLRSHRHVRQDLVTGYWREILDEPPGELARKTADGLAVVRDAKLPYLFVAGHDPGPEYLGWMNRELPQSEVVVWPGGGHFPHLAQPGRFAELLAEPARWA